MFTLRTCCNENLGVLHSTNRNYVKHFAFRLWHQHVARHTVSALSPVTAIHVRNIRATTERQAVIPLSRKIFIQLQDTKYSYGSHVNDYHHCQSVLWVLDNHAADSHVTHHAVSCITSWKLNIEFLLTTQLTSSNTVSPNLPCFPFLCITQTKMALAVFYMYACAVYCTLSGATIWRVKYSLL